MPCATRIAFFIGLLKHLPWGEFDRLVTVHRADSRVRRLTTKSQLVALLYGQLAGATSLRDIVAGLHSHQARLYHLGARPAAALDAWPMPMRDRPARRLRRAVALMVGRARRGLRRSLAETIYLIDSTGLRLDGAAPIGRGSPMRRAAPRSMSIYDPDGDRPVYAVVTAGACQRHHRRPRQCRSSRGATYVFDLGYYDYDWWAKLDRAQCRIVTRFKSNTPLAAVEELPVPAGTAILSDRIGHLPRRQGSDRNNPFQDPVREVRVQLDTGKVLRLLCNDLDAPAQQIADLYKRRWAIELFFRWVKQTLKIRRFLGTSENAVRIQIAVALIAFLLLRLAQAAQDIQLPAHSPSRAWCAPI